MEKNKGEKIIIVVFALLTDMANDAASKYRNMKQALIPETGK